MRIRVFSAVTAALLASAGTLTVAATGATAAPSPTGAGHAARVCARPSAGMAGCHALVRTDAAGKPQATAAPSGYGPADLQSAYKLAGATSRPGATVAIVDAYDDPTAEADLGVYRAQYGLPACTTANGCFQQGQPDRRHHATRGPNARLGRRRSRSTSTWSRRSAPTATSCWSRRPAASFANLGAAVNHAAAHAGVVAISNSYGGVATPRDATYGAYYNHPGIAITASLRRQRLRRRVYPASSHVRHGRRRHHAHHGGTSARGWTETAWTGAGSGCSTLQHRTQPAWQTVGTGCAKRADGRRLRGRRPEHRRRRLRHAPPTRASRLAGLRRHQRLVADHRLGLRPGRQHRPATPTPYPYAAHRRRCST